MSNPNNAQLPQPRTVIGFYSRINKYHLFVVVHGVSGTHDNYDVLFNSDCSARFFDTILEAATEAEILIANHKQKYGY